MDQQADENKNNNCVVASLAAGMNWLLQAQHAHFDGDEIKDAVYGQGYLGPTSASRFVAYAKAHGVTLAPVGGSQSALVAALHSHLKAGQPCLVTMPSNWGTAPADPLHPSGSTHVGIAAGEEAGSIRVMNPWGGFWQDQSDSWWQARLCYGQVWPLSLPSAPAPVPPQGDFPVLQLTDVVGFFTGNADGSWQSRNGFRVYGNILAFYRNNAGLRLFGLPLSDELVPDATYVGRVRLFERGAIAFDPNHTWDSAPGEQDSTCYAAHVQNGSYALSQFAAPLVAPLRASLAAAQADVAASQAQAQTLLAQLAAANATVATLTSNADAAAASLAADATTISGLQAQLASAQAAATDAAALVAALKKVLAD